MNEEICTEESCPQHTRAGMRSESPYALSLIDYVDEMMVLTSFSAYHDSTEALASVLEGGTPIVYMTLVVEVGANGTYGDVMESFSRLLRHREFHSVADAEFAVERHDRIVQELRDGTATLRVNPIP